LHIQCISTEYGSSSYMKFVGSKSRSQEQKRSVSKTGYHNGFYDKHTNCVSKQSKTQYTFCGTTGPPSHRRLLIKYDRSWNISKQNTMQNSLQINKRNHGGVTTNVTLIKENLCFWTKADRINYLPLLGYLVHRKVYY